ncbi:MAG: hypothetical protein U0166_07675 [Acidobacteriota bacterium]
MIALAATDGWAQIGSYSRYGWKERNQAAPFGPRYGHGMIYRPGTDLKQGIYLWGGTNGAADKNDMWRSSDGGASWISISQGATVPSPRERFGMAYDRVRDRIVVVGGNVNAETWHFDPVAQTWRQGQDYPGAAGSNTLMLTVYMDNIQKTVAYGGYTPVDDNTYGYAIDGSNNGTWSTLSTAGPGVGCQPNCAVRYSPGAAYDATRSVIVMEGGVIPGGPSLDEVWEFNGSVWTQNTQSPVPPARQNAAMAYDRNKQVANLFGGMVIAGAFNGEAGTWEFLRDDTVGSGRGAVRRPMRQQPDGAELAIGARDGLRRES